MRNTLLSFRNSRVPSWNVVSEFDEFFNRALQTPRSFLGDRDSESREIVPANFEVKESAAGYLVSVDVPGIRKEDIKIDLKENLLTITGERKRQKAGDDGKAVEAESVLLQRSFNVPSGTDISKIQAGLEYGVLTVTLPKPEAAKPRTIEISEGSTESKLAETAK